MALTKHPIADLIARRGGLVIDGAMSTPLEAAGLNLNDTLWSAKALLECPDLVRKVHYDYYAAGANAVEACSYQATEAAFARKGIEKAEASRLIRLSGELVREAKNDVLLDHPEWDPADLLTAGSIGPYGAYLADGSEYTGAYDLTREEYYAFHQLRLDELLNSGMDILAIETQPRFDEIEALLAMIAERDITCWVTVTLKDGDMPDGTKLEVLAKCLDADPHVEAFGFNCVKREWVEPGLKRLSAYTDKPLSIRIPVRRMIRQRRPGMLRARMSRTGIITCRSGNIRAHAALAAAAARCLRTLCRLRSSFMGRPRSINVEG